MFLCIHGDGEGGEEEGGRKAGGEWRGSREEKGEGGGRVNTAEVGSLCVYRKVGIIGGYIQILAILDTLDLMGTKFSSYFN